nr:hypothetical protein [Rhizobium indicum]
MVLRDTLLRVAAAGCFRAHWSARILDEMTRNLVSDYGMAPSRAEALRAVMEEAFPDASVVVRSCRVSAIPASGASAS